MIRGSKNLGQIKALHIGVNPPLNKNIIWFDDNTSVKKHKAYDFATSTWLPLGSNSTVFITGIFTYIAYATNCEGVNFSLTYEPNSTHFSVITSPTEIAPVDLVLSLFVKTFAPFCHENVTVRQTEYLIYKKPGNTIENVLQIGDIVSCWRNADLFWKHAIYLGGLPSSDASWNVQDSIDFSS